MKTPAGVFPNQQPPNLVRTHHETPHSRAAHHLNWCSIQLAPRAGQKWRVCLLYRFSKPKFSSSNPLTRCSVLVRYYFIRAEPLKIAKSASSSTPARERAYRFFGKQNADQEVPERTLRLPYFQVPTDGSVEVLKSNRSGPPLSTAGFRLFEY